VNQQGYSNNATDEEVALIANAMCLKEQERKAQMRC
jgi:hypothetical protein